MADRAMLANSRARFVRASTIELMGQSAAIGRAQELVRRAALLETGVLIVAERGAETESVGRELHARSQSADRPWIAIECDTGDGARVERALFGRAADALTDLESVAADSRIAAARGGTLFLQDVAGLPAAAQARLARIARDGEARVEGQAVPTEMRLVASALPAIDGDVRENRFRADLYRRLAVSRIDLPPLRERPEDVPGLAEQLLEDISATKGGSPRNFTHAALALLAALSWPGNLAELRAVVERAAAHATDRTIPVEQVLPALTLDRALPRFTPTGNLREARTRFERDYIAAVLQYHGWRMAEAAQTLGIQRPNLYRKARQLGIPVARLSE